METIQKKIQNKQEELEALVKEAQNNNDSSKAELISDLQVEIKSLSENASTLIDEIKSLQSEYNANAIRLTSMSATAQSQQANAVAQANAVEGVNSVNATNEVTNPIGSTSTASTQSTKFERKTLSEYITEIDSKLESVWTQFGGDAQKVQQYIKNNLNDFADVDGDGVLTPVDNLIISKWQNKHSTNREDYESSEKRNALIGTAENSVYKVMFRATQRCSESYMMNLEDLEFYFQNGGTCGCAFLGKVTFGYWGKTDGYNQYGNSSNIDYTKIAQSEDWEQRLDNLFSIVPGLKHTSEKIKDYVSKISDFVKANPQNATYASAAVTYQLRLEEYNKKKEEAEKIDWDQKAQEKLDELNEKYQEALKTSKSEYKDYLKYTCNNKKEYAASYETYCKLNVYNGGFDGDTKDINSLLDSSNLVKSVSQVAQNLKSQYLGTPPEEWSYTKSLDINSDGKVNADDLANFCTEIDLDGDGTVSDAERSYLNNTKKKLDNKVYKNMKNTGMYNQNSIDDVISYYSNVDVQAKYDRMNEMYEQLKQELQAHIDRSNAIWDRNEKIEDVALLGMRRAIPLTSYILGGVPTLPCSGYLDGTCGDKDYIDKLCFGNINVVLDAWKKGMEMTEPSNMYLHYVQSADLSKEELQSILNKINSASSEIQEKLSEVKNAVEQRLKSM